MYRLSLPAAILAILAFTNNASAGEPGLFRRIPIAAAEPGLSTPLKVTTQSTPLMRVKTNGTSVAASSRLTGYGKAKLRDLDVEEEWAIQITLGGEQVLVILDTGSSDTWVAQSDLQCVSAKLHKKPQASCHFGPFYNGSFTNAEQIKNTNFNVSYGDGEFATGVLGYKDVTIAGLKVKNQEVALVNKAFWQGDDITSGLVGIAYSALTSAYVGNDPTLDNFNNTGTNPGDQTLYSPIVQTMIAQGLNPPLFSLALQRSKNDGENTAGGYIAFAGLPPVAFDPVFASTPIEIYEFYGYPQLEAKSYSFYTISPQAYIYGTPSSGSGSVGSLKTHHSNINAIVDSGTTLMYVPTPVLSGYIASFNPPATTKGGAYYYPCNATAPYFGVKVGGSVFNISSADIIVPDSGYTAKDGTEFCQIGVADGGAGAQSFPIWGDVFLKNVVAVFDIGASMLRLAQHNY